ncbi:MAG: 4-(cytidine 5'-diphospho)-2-C-methyl-D-erythritol kinase [Pyrinomonadaceae bacterium]
MNQPALSLPSFAKINWSLQILGKRPDGYHEVRTILQTISLHDDLHFEGIEDGAIILSCNDPDIPTDDENLVLRAAFTLKTRFKINKGARIHLEKRIPTKAGLGGASSNAAVSLLALAHIWNVEPTAQAFLEVAAGLGADVPFFLAGGCALATGTGATVSALPDTAVQHILVVTPKASVATARAYAEFSSTALTTMNTDPILSSLHGEGNWQHSVPWASRGELINDFESVIFDIEPEIKRTKEALLQAGALGALLAGSGSSVFGIFADQNAQQRAVNEIKREGSWRIFPCVTVSRNEYFRAIASGGVSLIRSFNSGSDTGA